MPAAKHESPAAALARKSADELRDQAAALLPGMTDLYGRLLTKCAASCNCGACYLVGASLGVLREVARGLHHQPGRADG